MLHDSLAARDNFSAKGIREPHKAGPPKNGSSSFVVMSGFEVVGLILGSVPLLISALEHYSDGVSNWKHQCTKCKKLINRCCRCRR